MKKYWRLIVLAFLAYVSVVTMIDRFMHPEYTETQLMMRLPNTIKLDFK